MQQKLFHQNKGGGSDRGGGGTWLMISICKKIWLSPDSQNGMSMQHWCGSSKPVQKTGANAF
jgi:hypothetical protein